MTENEATTTEAVLPTADEGRLNLDVTIDDVGPCRKHIQVTVSRADLDRLHDAAVEELSTKAEVPGFRKGNVPKKLIGKRFKSELADEVKQKVLLQSLEQVSDENNIDPIDEPNIDVESLDVPEQGDFSYEFEVEVRPDFDVPDFASMTIERPTKEITDADVDNYIENFLKQYGTLESVDGAASAGDYIEVKIEITKDGKHLNELNDVPICVKPTLRFRDAELTGFDQLVVGAVKGDERETDLTISSEAETVEMRGETVQAKLSVNEVKSLSLPELNSEFLEKIGVESEDDLRSQVNDILERQVTYEQRQTTREQVLEKITESADWDLPEELVNKQVDNAMHREILEMQQAGFTTQEIQSRENELRQRSVSTTRQAMKEHFVLDKIANDESIEAAPSDIEVEIQMMAMQRGENPRRLRARLIKSGVIENLEAQIRERKTVDFILDKVQYKDVPIEETDDSDIEAVNRSICASIKSVESSSADEGAEEAE